MGLHPTLQKKLEALIAEMKLKGHEVAIHSGYRSFAEQQKLYNQGRSTPGKRVTNAKPGQSYHNFGLAADIVFKDGGKWSWAENKPWKLLGEVGKKLGLTWGGDFVTLKDRPHFQHTGGLSLSMLNTLYHKGGIPEVWKNIL